MTDVDFDTPCQVAVTIAIPGLAPGLRVTVAIPFVLVFAVDELRVPLVVAKLTCVFATRLPTASRIVTVIVDFIWEFAAITVGFAVISICWSLTRTASNGIVCP